MHCLPNSDTGQVWWFWIFREKRCSPPSFAVKEAVVIPCPAFIQPSPATTQGIIELHAPQTLADLESQFHIITGRTYSSMQRKPLRQFLTDNAREGFAVEGDKPTYVVWTSYCCCAFVSSLCRVEVSRSMSIARVTLACAKKAP